MIAELASMMTLEQARALRQMRREDLASRANVGLSTIIRAENGQRVPRYPVKLALATALGLSVDDIDWTGKKSEE